MRIAKIILILFATFLFSNFSYANRNYTRNAASSKKYQRQHNSNKNADVQAHKTQTKHHEGHKEKHQGKRNKVRRNRQHERRQRRHEVRQDRKQARRHEERQERREEKHTSRNEENKHNDKNIAQEQIQTNSTNPVTQPKPEVLPEQKASTINSTKAQDKQQ